MAEIKKKKRTVYTAITIIPKNVFIIFTLEWQKYFGDLIKSMTPI